MLLIINLIVFIFFLPKLLNIVTGTVYKLIYQFIANSHR